MESAHHVLDHDHGTIDNEAEVDGSKAHEVAADAAHSHGGKRNEHRKRYGRGNDESTAKVAEQEQHNEFKGGKDATEEAVASMLGPTGNMRAPTIKIGKTLIVGFNEDVFIEKFG